MARKIGSTLGTPGNGICRQTLRALCGTLGQWSVIGHQEPFPVYCRIHLVRLHQQDESKSDKHVVHRSNLRALNDRYVTNSKGF